MATGARVASSRAIFSAVAAGVRTVDPKAQFSTHVSGITAMFPKQAVAFYEAMRTGGFLPDQLGFSFYPSSSDKPDDRLQALEKTLQAVHDGLKRPVFLAEFGYPTGPVREGAFATWNHALEQFPISEDGQAALIRRLAEWGPEQSDSLAFGPGRRSGRTRMGTLRYVPPRWKAGCCTAKPAGRS